MKKNIITAVVAIVLLYLATIGAYLHGSILVKDGIGRAWLAGICVNALCLLVIMGCIYAAISIVDEFFNKK